MNQATTITVAELKQAMDRGTRVSVIDVRTPAEYAAVHLEGSVLMPVDTLDCAAAQAAAGDAALRVLVCQSGIRSDRASHKLAAHGGASFVQLDGGIVAWQKAGMPVIRGRFILPLERQVFTVAGMLVLSGVLLGWQVDPRWYGLSGFVGVGLMMAGLTGFCPMAILLARMPWNQRTVGCRSGCGCARR
jgi:rhodanese-related sulfurtransferase